MDFVSNKEMQLQIMLQSIGIENIEELFNCIPEKLKVVKPAFDDGLSEYEGMRLIEDLSAKNTYGTFENYLGAGAYEHHVPALVAAICSKSEFLTSYTPYQPEASQGMLQIIFEFQSAICALTGMDASNASLYDGASACAEAVLMALRLKPERNKIIISHALHPHYRSVLEQYLAVHDYHIEILTLHEDATTNTQPLNQLLDERTAVVLLQSPNFFGVIEDIKAVTTLAKAAGVLSILCSNLLAYGLFTSAAELGADIAVGDCQAFGLPLQFGGPYVGYIGCKMDLIRHLPGRIVGVTKDVQGRRGFVLTLQTREQHIRREKATSNICTNQALAALAALVAILWYGKVGLKKLALTNYQRAAYLKSKIQPCTQPPVYFNEFIFKCSKPIAHVLAHFRSHGIEPGLDLGRFYPEFKDHLLVAVTETKSRKQLDRYVEVAKCL